MFFLVPAASLPGTQNSTVSGAPLPLPLRDGPKSEALLVTSEPGLPALFCLHELATVTSNRQVSGSKW